MPQSPSGGGCMTPPTLPCPSVMMSMKALRSKLSAIARRRSGGVERRRVPVDDQVAADVPGATSQIASGT